MSAAAPHVTFGGLVRSEWIKLWSLRSTWWLYAITIVLIAGIAALAALSAGSWAHSYINPDVSHVVNDPGYDQDSMLRANIATRLLAWITPAIVFAQLLVSALGVVGIAGEHQTGMIRSTFAADPRRLGALAAKGLVSFLASLLVGVLAVALGFGLAVLVLEAGGWPLQLDDGYVWRVLGDAAAYLGFAGLFGTLIGTIIRSQAAGIPTAIGVLLVLPIIVSLLSSLSGWVWLYNAGEFLPYNLGNDVSAYPTAEVSLLGADTSRINGYLAPPGPWIEPVHDGYDQTTGAPDPALDSGRIHVGAAAAALALLAWLIVLGAIAGVTTKRRDIG